MAAGAEERRRPGDDTFDDIRLLRRTEGGVGHGRIGLALGPDGMIYLAMGNNGAKIVHRKPHRILPLLGERAGPTLFASVPKAERL